MPHVTVVEDERIVVSCVPKRLIGRSTRSEIKFREKFTDRQTRRRSGGQVVIFLDEPTGSPRLFRDRRLLKTMKSRGIN